MSLEKTQLQAQMLAEVVTDHQRYAAELERQLLITQGSQEAYKRAVEDIHQTLRQVGADASAKGHSIELTAHAKSYLLATLESLTKRANESQTALTRAQGALQAASQLTSRILTRQKERERQAQAIAQQEAAENLPMHPLANEPPSPDSPTPAVTLQDPSHSPAEPPPVLVISRPRTPASPSLPHLDPSTDLPAPHTPISRPPSIPPAATPISQHSIHDISSSKRPAERPVGTRPDPEVLQRPRRTPRG